MMTCVCMYVLVSMYVCEVVMLWGCPFLSVH